MNESAGKVVVDAGVRVNGTLGLLADAAERGWLDFDATVRRLVAETNFRVPPEVIGAVRRLLERKGAR
jgi:predicted nucleic acid-binding protein